MVQILAHTGHAQGQASQIFVTASKTSFIWGEPLKLSVVMRDNQGASITPDAVSWFADPAGVVTVANDGTVTPLSLRTVSVRATVGNLNAEIFLQVLPKKIVVIPERTAMTVGTTQTVRAEALDINDRPIPGVLFNWRLMNLLGFWQQDRPMASIDAAGKLQSLAQGNLLVTAVINYSPWLPGQQTEAKGETTINMQARQTYTFERLLVSKPLGASSKLMARPGPVFATEDDGVVFAASLDSVTSALLEWKRGTVAPLLMSGRSHSSTRQPLIDFTAYSRNRQGEMLTQETDAAGSVQVSSGPAQLQLPLLVRGTPLYGATETNHFTIQRNSLADSGYKLVAVNYNDATTERQASGLFRGKAKGLEEAVATSIDGWPGVPTEQFFWDKFGIASDGTAWFITSTQSTNQRTLWRQKPYGPIEKIIGSGDLYQGSEVLFVGAGGDSSLVPGLFVAGNGEVAATLHARNRSYYLRWLTPNSEPETLITPANGLHWHEPGIGTLLTTNYNRQGDGLYLWGPSGGVNPVLRLGETLNGSAVTEIYTASANSRGVVFAMVATDDSPMLIVRLQPDRQVVLKAGDELPVQAPVTIASFIPGSSSRTPFVIVGGQIGSIAQIHADGTIRPVVAVGDELPTGRPFRGSRAQTSGEVQARVLPNGDIVFVDGNGAYRRRNGRIEVVLQQPVRVNGVQVNVPYTIDVNSKGDIAGNHYAGVESGVYLFSSSGDGKRLVRAGESIDGETVNNTTRPAIDEKGNVAFFFDNERGSHVGYWDGIRVRRILSKGMSMPDGRKVGQPGWILKSSADSFLVVVEMDDRQRTYIRYKNDRWEYIFGRNDRMPAGNVGVSGHSGVFDVNSQGDVAFEYNAGTNEHIAARRGDAFHEIYDFGQFTAENELLLAVTNLHFKDDGTVFVLGTTDRGEQVIYRGLPGVAAPPSDFQSLTLSARGSGVIRTAGQPSNIVTGYARIQMEGTSSAASGLAIFGFRQNGVLISEAAVPAAPLIRSGRFFAEVGGDVNTGVAIANPNNEVAVVQFYATDISGAVSNSGSFTVGVRSQIAKFLDAAPFNTANIVGTFTFTSNVPIGVTALRGLTNEAGNFLITTLPVSDLSGALPGEQYLPHYAIGGGWTTQLILVNPTDAPIEGTFVFHSQGTATAAGAPRTVGIAGESSNRFTYVIPAKGMKRYVPQSLDDSALSGFVLISPKTGTPAPSALAVFSFRANDVTVTEAGVSGSAPNTVLRMYAETNGNFRAGERTSTSTGLALANTRSTSASVQVELVNGDGTSTGLRGSLTVPASGQVATFLHQISGLENVSANFAGTAVITSNAPVSLLGLRGRYNEAANFLITTIPTAESSTGERIFPHFADGGGYTTQFILINVGSGASTATTRFFNQQGQPLPLRIVN